MMNRLSHLHIDGWQIDLPARTAHREGRTEQLSPRATRLLLVLADADRSVVSRQTLLDRIWPNVTVSDESLTQVVAEVRRKLANKRLISTVARGGYRLTVPVFCASQPETCVMDQTHDFDFDAYRLCLDARLVLSRSGPGSVERAEEVAREAADRAPRFALAQAELSVMLVQRHLYRQGGARGLTEALERAQAAVNLRPDLASAHAALGYAWGSFDRWDKAKQSLGRAITCDQNDPDIHYLAARTLFAARDYAGATAIAERAAALDSDNFRPLYLASRAAAAFDPRRARRLGEQTLKRVRNRLETDPSEPRAINTLGPLLAHLGEYDAAAANMDAESAKGCPLEFYNVVARALMGDVPGAISTLEAVADRGWCHPSWLGAEPALAALASERSYQKLRRQLSAA